MSQVAINAIVQKAVEDRLRQLAPFATPQRNLRPWTTNTFSFAAGEEQQTPQPLAILDVGSPQSYSTLDAASPQAHLAGATPNSTPSYTPQEPQQLLRRSSSSCSSAASFSSSPAEANSPEDDLNVEDFAECYDDIVAIYKCSKKKLYKDKDKEVVRGPVMQRLDPLELAPFKSRLFRRMPKVGDPTSLKKNADLVFSEFKEIVRDIIRQLCAESKSTEPFLDQRYFWCAYDLVRKRRANHVQSWRLYDRPSNFTYGGKSLYEATYGTLKPLPKKVKKRRRERGKKNRRGKSGGQRKRRVAKELVFCDRVVGTPTPDEDADVPPCMEDESQAISSPPANIRRDGSVISAMDDSTTICYESEKEFDPFSDLELSCETLTCEECGSLFDTNNAFCAGKYCQACTVLRGDLRGDLLCSTCVKSLTPDEAFPKGNSEWHDGCTDVYCETCYARFVREQMLPSVNEHLEATQKKQKKRKATESESDKKKKKTQQTQGAVQRVWGVDPQNEPLEVVPAQQEVRIGK